MTCTHHIALCRDLLNGACTACFSASLLLCLHKVQDSEYCCWGDRNIDTVLLHPNRTDIAARLLSPTDGAVLPLDGLFSQQGEVFFKVQNKNATFNLSVSVPKTYVRHSTPSIPLPHPIYPSRSLAPPPPHVMLHRLACFPASRFYADSASARIHIHVFVSAGRVCLVCS